MLFLVPLAAPVHATNASALQISYASGEGAPLAGDGTYNYLEITVTNPSTNAYAVTGFTASFSEPGFTSSSWSIYDCYVETAYTFSGCTASGAGSNSIAAFYGGTSEPNYPGLLPGASATLYVYELVTPSDVAGTVYPITAQISTTIQDASSAAYYTGPTENIQVISPASKIDLTWTPGGSNTATSFTAGTSPYTLTATVVCTDTSEGCPSTGYEQGVQTFFAIWNETSSEFQSAGLSTTSGSSNNVGTLSTTVTPSNHEGDEIEVFSSFGSGVSSGHLTGYSEYFDYDQNYTDNAKVADGYTVTVPGAPASVGFTYDGATFSPSTTEYLTTKGTTTDTSASYPSGYTGAEVDVTTTAITVSVTDKFGNPITFGTGATDADVLASGITVQAASGAVFDTTGLPGSFSNAAAPTGSHYDVPYNYYQSGTYGAAGAISATITGTYGGDTFSVSGATGTLETSTFATAVSFTEANLVTAFPASDVDAGKTASVYVVLGTVQTGVPITVDIAPHTSGTTTGYVGTFANGAATTTLDTNSSGAIKVVLTPDETEGDVAVLNASVTVAPSAAAVTANSAGITTEAGSPAGFVVQVGTTTQLANSNLKYSVPSATDYVNVVTVDAYGNIAPVAGSNQIQITLNGNPATLSATNVYIPVGDYETNETGSFGAIAWTLPSTVGDVATITASGVLNGASVTSPTTSVTVVSKLPTLSVTSPTPTSGYLYTNTVNVQFRGWANASLGYNGAVDMSTIGYKIGSASWQSSSITGVDSQWSIVATLPQGLSTVDFNATDAKSNVVVLGTPYNVLVDLTSPTITFVTANDATVNGTSPLTATIVASEGDLNASSVEVTVNGTALASSAISVSGTNNPGSSVTYTVTATLPVGTWNVVISGTTLAGDTGTSSSITVTEIVQTDQSFTIVGSASQTTIAGNPDAITGVYKNNLSAPETITIIASASNSQGQQVQFATATVTISGGSTSTFDLVFVGLTKGSTYTISFYALSSNGVVVSQATTASLTA